MIYKKPSNIAVSIILSLILALTLAFTTIKISDNISKTESSVSKSTASENSSEITDPSAVQTGNSSVVQSQETSTPEIPVIPLKISSPSGKSVKVTQDNFTFSGTSDKEKTLTLNGNKVLRDNDGNFSVKVDLKVGNNTFKFSYNNETVTYTVNYRYVVIESYTPSKAVSYSSAETFAVSAKAKKGSTVTANFNGKTISLTPQNENSTEEFIVYNGFFTLPENNSLSDKNYGKVTFKATHNGISETFSSESVTCKKPDFITDKDPNYSLKGGKYVNVGTGRITEIVAYEAETFDAYSTNDYSKPTNNYLPKGTVDYSAADKVYTKSGEKKEYSVLRCGYQVYTSKKDAPLTGKVTVTKEYAGVLPDHNEIGISSFENGTTHTTLVLDTLWKAPFYFELLPQKYTNPAKQIFTISNFTATYVDITFCYATVFAGEIAIPENNPIFKSAEIIKNQSDYTLRLHLKKAGGFYGWSCEYNSQNQLVFKFLNPAVITGADNSYGYDLSGVRILIDVGHGGKDSGATSFSKTYTEAARNLYLAKLIKSELEGIGATVYLTRGDNSTSSGDTKMKMLKELSPDFCIAIHHNAYSTSSPNGFDSCYFTPYSFQAAKFIKNYTTETLIYNKTNLGWHVYYNARSTACPVVLTENGYITNKFDYDNIIDNNKNQLKAVAIVKGIVQYFKNIQ